MRLKSSSVTCIVLREFLYNIQVRLHVGDKHLLSPMGDEVLLPSYQLGDIFKNIQLGNDREFNENVCLVRKTHYQVRGGNANGGGGVPYLHGYLYLLVWLRSPHFNLSLRVTEYSLLRF